MTTTQVPITHTLKTLSACILVIAILKADALSRYWQQQWRVALPLAGNLTQPTWFNQLWSNYFSTTELFITTLNERLKRAGQALSTDPIAPTPAVTPAPISTAQCEDTPKEKAIDEPAKALSANKSLQWPISLAPADKVLLVGDSMMQGVAPYVMSALRKQYAAEAIDLSKHSTGLAYPGFFNWPDTIKEHLTKTQFKALVIFLGANDTWDIIYKGKSIAIGNDFWRSLYSERVESILTSAQEHAVQVIWLGAPPMGRDKMNKYVPALNQVYQASVDKFKPLAVFSPTANSLSSDGLTFSKFLT
ncbi:MAG TPA: hypothetical protein PK011_11185, partial [Marinagarivorans sp.]|nr:hypothetical protein [Marinagarivorans sp.]